MPSLTDVIPDTFTGSCHVPLNPETQLVPTGYTPNELLLLAPHLDKISTTVDFTRLEDADGAKLAMTLYLDRPIEGFYYKNHRYKLTKSATGLSVVCRSIVEIATLNDDKSISELVDKEFYALDDTGEHKGVVSWLPLIAEGALKATRNAFLASSDTRRAPL